MIFKRDGDAARLWHEMLAQSFAPWQWFVDDGEREEQRGNVVQPGSAAVGESRGAASSHDGGTPMYVVLKMTDAWQLARAEGQIYQVGFFDPRTKEFHEESRHYSHEEAAARVRWLHGGN